MSNEYIVISSAKAGKDYRINYLKSYRVEQSIDIPADAFEFIIGNTDYLLSGVASAGDKLKFYVDNNLVLDGFIDDIEAEYSNTSNDIRITGRDKMAILLDNDANPATYYKLSLRDYMAKILPKYDIDFYCSNNEKFNKIVVSPGENEFSIIERLAIEKGLISIFDVDDKLKCTDLISSISPSYIFSNTNRNAIKIIDANILISNDIRNEVKVYGETDKKKTVTGSYIDKSLKTKKRRILNESDIETTSNAIKRAKEEFYSINKNALIVTITTNTKKPIFINRCAKVDIERMGFSAFLLVDKVIYSKSNESGSTTNITLKLMPGVKVTYKGNDIPLLPKI